MIVTVRVIVLGGTRFVGPHVVRELEHAGHDVTIFHRGETEADLPSTVRHVHGRFEELEHHADALRALEPDLVLDMIPYVREDVARLRLFAGHAARAVAVSSMDVYRAFGRGVGTEPGDPEPLPLTEDSPLRSVVVDESYDKVGVEEAAAAIEGLPVTIVRLPAVHGPGDGQHRLRRYVRAMDQGLSTIALQQGVDAWRWLRGYVEDVAHAVALAVTEPHAVGRVYHVAYERSFSEREWVEAIARVHGWDGAVVAVPPDELPEEDRIDFDTRQSFDVDSSRIRDELGYAERVDFDEALRRTIEWERASA
jgi:nucleoside-diphosphate-sugar epimerase